MGTDDVDLYLPYVDGNDQVYAWQMLASARILGESRSETAGLSRINDFGQLRMALRSIYFCLPWVRHVHLIFHHERQIPPWLNRSHPKIKVHLHRDYFDARIELPTFSSFVIDTQIGRVPGLAERFIYIEDDQFLCRLIERSALFDDAGRPIHWCVRDDKGMAGWDDPRRYANTPRRIWPHTCKFSNLVWKRHLGMRDASEVIFPDGHRPFPFLKSIFEQTHRCFGPLYEHSLQERFRRNNVLSLHSYLIGMERLEQSTDGGRWALHRMNLPGIVPLAAAYESYDSGCINDETKFDGDDQRATKIAAIREAIEKLMMDMFPRASAFESDSSSDGGETAKFRG